MIQIDNFRVLSPAKPLLLIDRETLERAKYLVEKAPKECQWWFRVRRLAGKGIVAYELFDLLVPEQWCSGAEVESDPQMMIKLWKDLREERGLSMPELGAIMQDATCWCHSHVNMAPRPSGQDNKQWAEQKKLAREGGSDHPQLMMIFNKNHEFFSRVWDPELGLEFANVPLNVQDKFDTKEIEDIVKDKLKTKPAKKSWCAPKGKHNGAGSERNWQQPWFWDRFPEPEKKEANQTGRGVSRPSQSNKAVESSSNIQSYTSMDESDFEGLCRSAALLDSCDTADEALGIAMAVVNRIDGLIDDNDHWVLNTLMFGTVEEITELPKLVFANEERGDQQLTDDTVTLITNLSELPIATPTMLPEAIETTIDITCVGVLDAIQEYTDKWIEWYGEELAEADDIARSEGAGNEATA
jgi:proteasome lid subunit RPN8/RPN11